MSPVIRRIVGVLGATFVAVVGLASIGQAALASTLPATATTKSVEVQRLCANPVSGDFACMALRQVNPVEPNALHSLAISPDTTPSGYGPTDLRSAYALTATGSASETVAVVDALDDPNAASDLAVYRAQYGLPACTTANGCFSKVNQNGATSPYPTADQGWAGEISLDLDMVSAICPNCHVLLVEANTASSADLGAAVDRAVLLGAKFVSNSYGGDEYSDETTDDGQYYNHPGVAITASTGDSGYGISYPASSQYVTAVGGTTLTTASNTRGWTESAWSGGGAGCSSFEAQPTFQAGLTTGCTKRSDADVSAVADPNTGVAVYQTYGGSGWQVYGGTSVSSPIVASVYALAGVPGSADYPNSYPYGHQSALNDVISGSDGSCAPLVQCHAGAGYDGPTGLGTPNGFAAFTSSGITPPVGTVTNPGSQFSLVGTSITPLTLSVSGEVAPITWSASGLPPGLTISTSGMISGTPTTIGNYNTVTVTATDTKGHSGQAVFAWSISSTACAAAQLLGNPGFETGTAAPWTGSVGVIEENGGGETSHSGSWYAWLDGYGTTHTDTLSQTVTIPAGCTQATFSFWLHIDTAETTTTTQFDKLVVQANSTTIAQFSNLNAATGYTQHSYSLAAFAGQAVTLKFTGTEDSTLQTSFVIDDTAVNTGGTVSTPPAFTADSPPAQSPAGVSYFYQFAASGSPAPTFALKSGALPAGMTLSTTGVLFGTPTQAGTSMFTVSASNGVGSPAISPSLQLTVQPGPTSSIVSVAANPTTITAGTDTTLAASGADAYGNPTGNITGGVTFTASTGSCAANVCTSTTAGSLVVASQLNSNNSQGPKTSVTVQPGAATYVEQTSGNDQSAAAGNPFAQPLSATVTDVFGNPISATPVTFTVTAGSASFAGSASAQGTTNGSGVATSPPLSAGPSAGPVSVTATSGSLPSSVTYTETVSPGPLAVVTAASGGGQTAQAAQSFVNPLVATVTDAYGNAVPGASVTFAVTSGSATFGGVADVQVVTDATGTATSPSLGAGSVAGPVNVTVSISGLSASYSETVVAGPPAVLAPTSGGAQSATVATAFASPLAATLTDSYGNPIAATPVTFTVTAGSASFAGSASAPAATSGSGVAISPVLSAGTVTGPVTVTATGGGQTTSFSETVTAGVASALAATSGGGQTAQAAQSFVNPLVATVTDAYGNAVPGASVTFTVSGASASFGGSTTVQVATGADGTAVAPALSAGTTAGPITVTATVSGVSGTGSFAETVAPAAASAISETSGDNQTATSGAQFTNPLIATVIDTYGNPVPGVSVTFTLPVASATSGSATFPGGASAAVATTATNGTATSPAVTAGQPGAVVATAAIPSGVGTAFTLAVTAAGPARADLAITLSAPTRVGPGAAVTETVTVTNAGPSAATKLGTALVVPRGFTVTNAGGGTLFGHGALIFRDASLAAHGTVSYTVTLTATRTAGVYLTDAATASGVVDPNLRNNLALGVIIVTSPSR